MWGFEADCTVQKPNPGVACGLAGALLFTHLDILLSLILGAQMNPRSPKSAASLIL